MSHATRLSVSIGAAIAAAFTVFLPLVASAAIAFDTVSQDNFTTTGTTHSITATLTGSNITLVCRLFNYGTDPGTVSVVYNSVTATQIGVSQHTGSGAAPYTTTWYVPNASSGSHTLTWNTTNSVTPNLLCGSYTGTNTSSPIDTNIDQTISGSVTSYSSTLTTVTDNDWMVAFFGSANGRTFDAGSGTTQRAGDAGSDIGTGGSGSLEDSNAAITPAGSHTLNMTVAAGSDFIPTTGFALKPAAATPAATAPSPQTTIFFGD